MSLKFPIRNPGLLLIYDFQLMRHRGSSLRLGKSNSAWNRALATKSAIIWKMASLKKKLLLLKLKSIKYPKERRLLEFYQRSAPGSLCGPTQWRLLYTVSITAWPRCIVPRFAMVYVDSSTKLKTFGKWNVFLRICFKLIGLRNRSKGN